MKMKPTDVFRESIALKWTPLEIYSAIITSAYDQWAYDRIRISIPFSTALHSLHLTRNDLHLLVHIYFLTNDM